MLYKFQEAVSYTKREAYETKLLKFIFKEFDNKKISIAGHEEVNNQYNLIHTINATKPPESL